MWLFSEGFTNFGAEKERDIGFSLLRYPINRVLAFIFSGPLGPVSPFISPKKQKTPKTPMSNEYFQFKQFTVRHERCAMKVGTDGVLLGAWAPVEGVGRILDVGTGTGLVALQLAQRSASARITAIEIDPDAAAQAGENVAASPWSDRIEVVCGDFATFRQIATFDTFATPSLVAKPTVAEEEGYDLIVSNPPYFTEALQCPDPRRCTARHTATLDYALLFRRGAALLAPGGVLALIFPADAEPRVLEAAACSALYPCRRLAVYTKPGKPLRRLLMAFSPRLAPCRHDELYIHTPDGSYSEDYRRLTGDFYLRF